MTSTPRDGRGPAGADAAAALGAGALAVLAPAATYGASLALFGLAHVLSELGYVRRRFGGRCAAGWWAAVATLLALVVAVRVARGLLGWLPGEVGRGLELGLVALLAALSWRLVRGAAARVATVAVVLAVGLGAWLAPVATLLGLALLHNLTPLGFLVERAPAGRRGRVLLGWAAWFVGLPLLIATGLPWRLVSALGWPRPDLGLWPGTELASLLGAYVPRAWHLWPSALHLFAAAVCAQLLHYHAVIAVLPRRERRAPLRRGAGRGAAARATFEAWAPWLGAAACAGLALHFGRDFFAARRLYGVAAAVHAWLEVPVLIAALSGLAQPVERASHHHSSPAPKEAPLASAEVSAARGQTTGASRV